MKTEDFKRVIFNRLIPNTGAHNVTLNEGDVLSAASLQTLSLDYKNDQAAFFEALEELAKDGLIILAKVRPFFKLTVTKKGSKSKYAKKS